MNIANWIKQSIDLSIPSCTLDRYIREHNPTSHAQVEILTREFFGN